MKKKSPSSSSSFNSFWGRSGLGLRAKLIIIFLAVEILPLLLLTIIAWQQFITLGDSLRTIAVKDSSAALNHSAVENIERMSTDTATRVANFLYARDDDIRLLASAQPSQETFRDFIQRKTARIVQRDAWELSADGRSWVPTNPAPTAPDASQRSTNLENDDLEGFNYRQPENFTYSSVPLYDEITYIDLDGQELIKVLASNTTKVNHPFTHERRDVSKRENTFVKAETYFEKLKDLAPGEIYVSDVIGAYVPSNYIGMYTPDIVAQAAADRGYEIPYDPSAQSYAGKENPNGERFEGIVRWATPVVDASGDITGYVTFALNHDHIMEYVDHITPMYERYTDLPSAFEGNYAFIWDYQCRNIAHPRHNSIVGYDPLTGDPQTPWLESSIYEGWQASGLENWADYVKDKPTFDHQSRSKTPASDLTRNGLVGLDGRFLNNAPQCTGWMDLTKDGGSGSFYILWSNLYKLTTAAAIPYYTGQYAPSEANGGSMRGFGFITIGAGMEDFTRPATEMEGKLVDTIRAGTTSTLSRLLISSVALIILVLLLGIWVASSLTGSITGLLKGIARFRSGERHFRFNATTTDEFGTLANSFDDMADGIVDSVKNPLCIIDYEHVVLYANEQWLTAFGVRAQEAIGAAYEQNTPYPMGSKHCPLTSLEAGRESDILYMEDTERYVRGNANHFVSKEGTMLGYIIQSFDVTEIVLEQIEVERQRTLLDKIFSASPDLIWYTDAKDCYLAVNPRFAAIAGASPDAFLGKSSQEMLPGAVASIFDQRDSQAIESGKLLYSEETITFADGHTETVESVRTPLFDATGKPVGLLGFSRDVSARISIEQELRETQIELEKTMQQAIRNNEHKSEFLARMSHEIRTPMNAIVGVTDLLQRSLSMPANEAFNPAAFKQNVDQIKTSSQHLLGLLNDILDISKIEAGKIELSKGPVDLTKLSQAVVTMIQPRCDEKNVLFRTKFDAFSHSTFISDDLRLRQVLINLLGNAVKFTPEHGAITFGIEHIENRDGATHVRFYVQDTGIGIAHEALKAIFAPFEQENSSVSRQYGGTGLGLAISERIVELFGGHLGVQSTLGEGSTFGFSLWLEETHSIIEEDVIISDATGRFKGKRILLADDVDINRMIVIAMLEGTGLLIDEAEDGAVALQKFRDSDVGMYDLILMDVRMPNMDGYEATSSIRLLDRPDARTIPIIALTANAFHEDIARAKAHGMNSHLAKPVEMEVLLKRLFKYLHIKP